MAAQNTGQISVLLDSLSSAKDVLILWIITLFANVFLLTLANRPGKVWRVIDALIYFIPIFCLIYITFGNSLQSALIDLGGLILSVLLFRIAINRTQADGRLFLIIAGFVFVVWIAVHFAVVSSSIEFTRYVGAIAFIFLFLALSALSIRLIFFRFLVGAVATISGIIAFFFYEPTHFVEQPNLPAGNTDEYGISAPSLQEAFAVWLASRNDLDEYLSQGKAYPVFVISSEGGGAYAAAHAHLFLSKMQQRCPNFTQHIFSIVGVSGGAVGNTQFLAKPA